MKSFILTSLAACALSTVLAAPAVLHPRDSCTSPVTLTGNAFADRALHTNPNYAFKVATAITMIANPDLATKAAKIGNVGAFIWIDTVSVIQKIDAMIKAVPCNQIIGFVVYNLPGRDCAAGASGGELPAGSMDRYRTEYIDVIRQIILANPNTAIALVIEPDSLPNVVTNANVPACQAAIQGYKDGVAYASAQLNLPNVVMYIDAGNGGWLGWIDNLTPGAKLIADVWKAAGSPSQVKGIATNVANFNAWSQIPGEFENAPDAQWNIGQDEQRYVHAFGAELAKYGAPNHAIMDTSRNGRTGLRLASGDWCNIKGAAFGVLPTGNTGDDLADAFVWIKLGGESDGSSDPSGPGYDSTCARPDAFQPAPRAGEWNQAYFEELVANSADTTTNPAPTAVPSQEGQNVLCQKTLPFTCVRCTTKDVNNLSLFAPARWTAAFAEEAVETHHYWYEAMTRLDLLSQLGLSRTYVRSMALRFNTTSVGLDWVCTVSAGTTCQTTVPCGATDNPATSMILTSWANIRTFYYNQYIALVATSNDIGLNAGQFAATFIPQQEDGTKAFKIMIDLITMGFGILSAGSWNTVLKTLYGKENANSHGWSKDGSNAIITQSLGLMKDTFSAPPSPLGTQNKISEALSKTTKVLQQAISEYGSNEGMAAMAKLLKGGKWVDPIIASFNLWDMQQQLTRTLYGMLLTKAWYIEPRNNPFIIVINKINSTENPTNQGGAVFDVSNQNIAAARIFLGDKTYIFMNMGDCYLKQPDADGRVLCVAGGVGPIGGIGVLTAKANVYGNITLDDIVTSSVQGYALNGGKNGYVMPENSRHTDGSGTLSDLMYENGIRTPGFFNFPICEYQEAKFAWLLYTFYEGTGEGGEKCATYPCCPY